MHYCPTLSGNYLLLSPAILVDFLLLELLIKFCYISTFPQCVFTSGFTSFQWLEESDSHTLTWIRASALTRTRLMCVELTHNRRFFSILSEGRSNAVLHSFDPCLPQFLWVCLHHPAPDTQQVMRVKFSIQKRLKRLLLQREDRLKHTWMGTPLRNRSVFPHPHSV